VGGSLVGAIAGAAIGLGLVRIESGASLSVPFLTAGGAAAGSLFCDPSEPGSAYRRIRVETVRF
jgi:hypothetical protein